MHLEWTLPAIGNIEKAGDFISLNNPQAAKRMSERVKEAVEYLIEFPNIGRPGRVTGTKELVVSGTLFIVVYRVKVPVIHARKWPE